MPYKWCDIATDNSKRSIGNAVINGNGTCMVELRPMNHSPFVIVNHGQADVIVIGLGGSS